MAQNTPYSGEWPIFANVPQNMLDSLAPSAVQQHLRDEFPDCLTDDIFPAFVQWAWDTKGYTEPDADGMIEIDSRLLLNTDGDKFLDLHVGTFHSLSNFRAYHVQQYDADPDMYADEIIEHGHHIYPLASGELLFVWKG